jgi:hypothetical protein
VEHLFFIPVTFNYFPEANLSSSIYYLVPIASPRPLT